MQKVGYLSTFEILLIREDLHCGPLQQPPERQVVSQDQEGGPQVVQDEKSDLSDGPGRWQHCRRRPRPLFQAGEKINIDVYLGVFKEVVKPWIDEKASGDVYNGRYLFQQDSAPAHKAKKTQEWLQANVPCFLGPPDMSSNSPDLNPMDYYI
ncbi:Transposable element tcb2 transposase [Caligus rogercresseyi]|uniref:Transposable element tcb2 transposase n=1 Tax=Caligus rogercresseyi TaxID=217165 RepID=A0A7T8KEN5_CALRO|nr:Transposable element tcb2 transposase [Caligus rogercresseyi]